MRKGRAIPKSSLAGYFVKPVSYFIQLRGSFCESCGRPFTTVNPAQRHHAIEHRQKRYPELDNDINIEIVCMNCHMSGKLDTQSHAVEFAKRQIARGYNVLEWYDSLPLKTRRFNLKGLLE